MSNDPRKGVPSASGMGRIAKYPGSFLLEKKFPNPTNEAAEKGTYLHKILEDLLNGKPYPADISTEDHEFCETALRIKNKLVEEFSTNHGGTAALYSTEERVYMDDFFVCVLSGQWDAVFKVGNKYLILDWKTGRVAPDPAEENMQLRALAVLLAEKLYAEGLPYEAIAVSIIQPWVTHSPDIVEYSLDDLTSSADQVLRIALGAINENSPLNPSESACKYCRAKSGCPALKKEVVAQQQDTPSIRDFWMTYTQEEKSNAYNLACLAESWAASIKTRCREDMIAGKEIPGLKLKQGAKKRSVTDAQKAYSLLAEQLHCVTGEDFSACCNVKISELEKYVHKVRVSQTPEGTKAPIVKDTKSWMEEILSSVLEVKENQPSVERA